MVINFIDPFIDNLSKCSTTTLLSTKKYYHVATGAETGAALFCYLVLAESGGNSDLAWQQYIKAK